MRLKDSKHLSPKIRSTGRVLIIVLNPRRVNCCKFSKNVNNTANIFGELAKFGIMSTVIIHKLRMQGHRRRNHEVA